MKLITLNYIVNKEETINNFLKEKHFSDNNIFYLIQKENIKVNEEFIKGKNFMLKKGYKVAITLNPEINELKRNESPLDIVYEDDYLLVINKPINLNIEPSITNQTNNLASMISHYFDIKDIPSKIHLVNRLDNPTSGLVIVAKNRYIKNLFKYVDIKKKYFALVSGIIKEDGLIKIDIIKSETTKRVVSKIGKECITEYKVVKHIDGNTLVDINLLTGRTHQIRVSFFSINHPLINDPLYNEKKPDGNMYLKAYGLEFIHPITNEFITINKSTD